MNFPLLLRFKKIAIAHQITVTDAQQALVCYVKQKAFKLREAVTVFADVEQTRPLFTINADRVIDFSANYAIAGANGQPIGSVGRKGMRSIWRSKYEISRGGVTLYSITEENPWAKVADGLLGEIPVVGIMTGRWFQPRYLVTRRDGTPVLRVIKNRAFLEGKFTIEKIGELPVDDETLVVLSILMMVLLERRRG